MKKRDFVAFRIIESSELKKMISEEFQHGYNTLSLYRASSKSEESDVERNIEEVTVVGYRHLSTSQLSYFIGFGFDFNFNFAGAMDGGSSMYGGGGGSSGGSYSSYPQTNPCAKASAGSQIATANSQSNSYLNSKNEILNSNLSNENGVVFGNVNGVLQSTGLQTGGTSNMVLSHNFTDPIADLHNHPNENPPSVGDLYSLITNRNNFPNYNTRYVITPNGTTYALIVTDINAMNQFLQNYPPSITSNPNGGNHVNFPGNLKYEYSDIINVYWYNEETALSFMLDKYNVGIALTKLNANGNFKKISTKESLDNNGEKIYILTNCD